MRNRLGAKYGGGEGGRRADQGPREGEGEKSAAGGGVGRAMAARPKEERKVGE